MNILELCLSAGLGGLELYVYRTAEALQNKHIAVLTVLSPHSKLADYFQQNSTIKIKYLHRHNNPLPLRNAKKLARIIDKNNIDVIHMHWGKDLPLAAFAKAFSKRKPALVYTRQMMITRKKDDIYHNFLYKQMDLMLTITRELELLCKQYIPRHASKITTLYYGVKAPAEWLDKKAIQQQRNELGSSTDAFIVGLIGRLEESKGQHLLIDAVSQAKQHQQTISALIVGHEMHTGYRDQLKQQAQSLGISAQINFLDFSNKPQQLMQLCDVVVLASGEETFGLVLAEAMRAGVAVIGSNKGGVPEIISHEDSGLLFASGNSNSLYQQIERLYLDPGLKKILAENGRAKADKAFNNDHHFAMLEQHLRTINHPQLITHKNNKLI